jgi:hypothetical protein
MVFMAYCKIATGVDWSGVEWICKIWSGFVKGGFVKDGFVRGGFVKGGFVKGGFVKGGFVKHGFVKGGFVKNDNSKLKRATRTVRIFFFRADQIGNRAIKAKDCGTQGTISDKNVTVLKENRMLSYNIISQKFVQAANKINCYLIL